MTAFTILSDTPFIGYIDNFLSTEECDKIIEFGKINPVASEIYDDTGTAIVNLKERDSQTTYTTEENGEIDNLIDLIYSRVSNVIEIDKSRFEKFQITQYKPNMHLNLHWDYFTAKDYNPQYTESIRKMCSKGGGNRVSTVVLYLNDTEEGGETYFPWQNIAIKPKQGRLIHFKYNYDDPMNNIKSAHTGMPVTEGNKWIVTILITEVPLDQPIPNFNRFSEEGKIITSLHDTCYELECGPEDDRRILSISLPANDDPRNTLVVGFTGGIDSSLLLYLLGMLNTHQIIPYIILPVVIDSLYEDYEKIPLMVSLIQSRLKNKGGILDFTYRSDGIKNSDNVHTCPSYISSKEAIFGMLDYFNNRESKFRKHKFLYTGTILPPGQEECVGMNTPTLPNFGIIKNPLYNLKKYHIVDILLQLDLEDVLKLTSADSPPGNPNTPRIHAQHKNLTEECYVIACMERRWAFTKLLGREQMGMDYFVNKYIWDPNHPEIEPINRYEDEVLKKNNLIR